jgi:hypothetical protein
MSEICNQLLCAVRPFAFVYIITFVYWDISGLLHNYSYHG